MRGIEAGKYRALLEQRSSELRETQALGEQAADTVELDQARVGRLSRMDALQQQAMSAAEQRRHAVEQKRIASALQRIANGEYGMCLRCGSEIPQARLLADPAATLCVGCAEQAESER